MLHVAREWQVFGEPKISEGYQSETGYYSGRVKNYTMHLTNPSNFWYATHQAAPYDGCGASGHAGCSTGFGT